MNKVLALTLLLLLVLAAACSAPPPTPTPVPTANPTDTPAPTSTPLPTATNTTAPTATNTLVPTATNTVPPTNTPTPPPTNTRTATPTPSLTPTPSTPTSVVLVDDFSTTTTLRIIDDADHTFALQNGEYSMLSKKGNYLWRVGYTPTYDDAVISVEGRVPNGDAGVDYGLYLRYASDGTYYMFVISPDGSYSLYLYNPATKWTTLIKPTRSDAIKQGAEKNRLQVIMQGNQFALYVNDQFLDTVTDSSVARGYVGLVISVDKDNGQAVFDNVIISKINRALALPAGKERPPTPTPMPDIPPGMGGLAVTNWMGVEMNYTVGGKLYKIPGTSTVTIFLPPGKYTFSFDAPGGIKANCSTAQGCTVNIDSGTWTTQAWRMGN